MKNSEKLNQVEGQEKGQNNGDRRERDLSDLRELPVNELLLIQQDLIENLREEIDKVKKEKSKLENLKVLASLTGILNLLNLKSDPELEFLVREMVFEGLRDLNSNPTFRLPR